MSLTEPPPAWWGFDDVRDIMHWTGALVWVILFLSLGFLGSVFRDERGLSVLAGLGSVVVALVTVLYFAIFFGRALPPETTGSLDSGWLGTVLATAILGTAVGIRIVVVMRNLDIPSHGYAEE